MGHRRIFKESGKLIASSIDSLATVRGKVIAFKLIPLQAMSLLLICAYHACRRIFKETGKLLIAFSIGSVATVVGTVVAFKLIPLQALGATDSWKIASALAARHIGGAINYVAVSEALQVSPSAQMAGLAADNLL